MIANQNRKIKQSPSSSISLHQKVLNNCINAIRSKRHTKLNLLRNNYITQRNDSSVNENNTNQHNNYRKELMENFVNDIYNETQIENDMNNEFSIDALTEIMQAIESEMQEFEMNMYEEQLQAEEALEKYIQYSLYDEFSDNQYQYCQDNNIICFVCMLSNMNTTNHLDHTTTISCNTCGTIIHIPISIIDFKNKLAFIYDSHSIACGEIVTGLNFIENETTSNTTNNNNNNNSIFNIDNYNNKDNKDNNVNNKSNARFTFHMSNDHLYAYCSECALNIQVI